MTSLSHAVDQTRPAERSSIAGWTGSVACAVIALSLLAVLWGRPINHDTAWYLISTRDWLAGATLYVDIVEVNPPLAFYLTIPAVLLAEVSPIGLVNAQYVMICALVWISLTLIWRLTASLPVEKRGLLLLASAGAMVVPFLSAIAQREHLMVIFVLPWIAGRIVRGAGAAGETGRALFAALGVCIKPYFVLYPLAVTLHDVWRTRSLRPVLSASNLIFLAVGLSYVGLVAIRHPLYLTDIAPMARDIYGGYAMQVERIVAPLYHPALLLGLFAVAIAARSIPNGGVLVVTVGAALAIYVIQWKGFTYHLFPAVSFLFLGAGLLLASSRLQAPRGLLAFAVVLSLAAPFVREGFHSNDSTDALTDAILGSGGSERLYVVSTTLPQGPAVALATGAEWTSRYPALWLVPGAVNGLAETDCGREPDRCSRLRAIRDRTRAEIVTDLTEGRPDVLIFDGLNDFILVPDFDWKTFLAQDPRFATLMEAYGSADTVGPFRIHRRTRP